MVKHNRTTIELEPKEQHKNVYSHKKFGFKKCKQINEVYKTVPYQERPVSVSIKRMATNHKPVQSVKPIKRIKSEFLVPNIPAKNSSSDLKFIDDQYYKCKRYDEWEGDTAKQCSVFAQQLQQQEKYKSLVINRNYHEQNEEILTPSSADSKIKSTGLYTPVMNTMSTSLTESPIVLSTPLSINQKRCTETAQNSIQSTSSSTPRREQTATHGMQLLNIMPSWHVSTKLHIPLLSRNEHLQNQIQYYLAHDKHIFATLLKQQGETISMGRILKSRHFIQF